MLYNLLPQFKVVEINNVAALRMGHIIAQTPAKAGEVATYEVKNSKQEVIAKFLENGVIVGYDKSGYLKNYSSTEHTQPCLVYTEELITANMTGGLDQFANEFDANGVVYPRVLPLNLGDAFTTNNVSEIKDGYAYVSNGVLTIDETYTAGKHMFIAKVSDLPAGQEAVEFTYIGLASASN